MFFDDGTIRVLPEMMMLRTSWRCWPHGQLLVASLALVLLIGGSAVAGDDDADAEADASAEAEASAKAVLSDELVALVEQLSHPVYEEREGATYALKAHGDLGDEALAAAVRKARSPEVVHRLRRVALHRFYRDLNPTNEPRTAGRAGLGIWLDDSVERVVRPDRFEALEHSAIFVTDTIPGFPAYEHLRRGDLIIGIDGEYFDETLTNDSHDPDSIQQRYLATYSAGDEAVFHIVRHGERQDVAIVFDNFNRVDAVNNAYGRASRGGDPAMHGPFVDYLRDLGVDEAMKRPSPIEAGRPGD